jgi:hypothetical protein
VYLLLEAKASEKVYTIKIMFNTVIEAEVYSLLIVTTCFHLQVAETPTRKKGADVKNDVEHLNSLVASVTLRLQISWRLLKKMDCQLREHSHLNNGHPECK